MQYPLDWFAKGILQGALKGLRVVHLEEPVTPEVLSLDAWIEPIPGVVVERGLLGELTREPCVVEPFQPDASLLDVDRALVRVSLLHDKQCDAVPKPAAGRRVLPPRPRLWVVSAEPCDAVLREWLCDPDPTLGPGVYRSRVATRGPGVVVPATLPRSPETVALRLMGHGEVLQRALDDLDALPHDAWEREVVRKLLRVVASDFARRGIIVPDLEAREVIIDYKIIEAEYEEYEKRVRGEGRVEGRVEGRTEGLRPLVRQMERRLGRALSDDERTGIAARFDLVGPERLGDLVLDLAPDALAAWVADPNAR